MVRVVVPVDASSRAVRRQNPLATPAGASPTTVPARHRAGPEAPDRKTPARRAAALSRPPAARLVNDDHRLPASDAGIARAPRRGRPMSLGHRVDAAASGCRDRRHAIAMSRSGRRRVAPAATSSNTTHVELLSARRRRARGSMTPPAAFGRPKLQLMCDKPDDKRQSCNAGPIAVPHRNRPRLTGNRRGLRPRNPGAGHGHQARNIRARIPCEIDAQRPLKQSRRGRSGRHRG